MNPVENETEHIIKKPKQNPKYNTDIPSRDATVIIICQTIPHFVCSVVHMHYNDVAYLVNRILSINYIDTLINSFVAIIGSRSMFQIKVHSNHDLTSFLGSHTTMGFLS